MTKIPKYDPTSLKQRAEGRIRQLPVRLKVTQFRFHGARILEVGCGNGECTDAAIRMLDADAYGIDIVPRWSSGPYAALGEAGRLFELDISDAAARNLLPFDFVHSYTVFEHIVNPRAALENIFHLLNPGGRAFLSFNLYLGASASHLRGYLPEMPWIHLTHSDQEVRKIMLERHGKDRGICWVNHFTDEDYKRSCNEIGFNTLGIGYIRIAIEDKYYEQHKDKLGKYSKKDLSKNFMNMLLERPLRV